MMKKLIVGGAVMALSTGISLPAFADDDMKKLGPALEHVYGQSQEAASDTSLNRGRSTLGRAGPNGELMVANVSDDGFVNIDAVAADDVSDLEATVEALGGRNVSSLGRTVSVEMPADRLSDLASSAYLAFARPVLAETNVGLVTSQADRSMRTDIVRQELGFDGTGLTIGILSDSFACDPGSLAGGPYTTPAEDVANGDIPANVLILDDFLDQSTCIDEGRGMAQLIHDIVPGAKLAFHTAFNGEADFAQGIIELAEAGADVIVDDVIYFTEPMFQDGVIAQAADEVARLGVPYYSSNGNRERASYSSEFRPLETTIDGVSGVYHDFDPNGDNFDPTISLTLTGLQTNLSFQWDQPNFSVSGAPGAESDIDIIMIDPATGQRVPDCFPGGVFQSPANGLCQFLFTDNGNPIDGGAGGDAVELVSLVNFLGVATVDVAFYVDSGPAPGFVKWVNFGSRAVVNEYDTLSPSGFGHNNAAGAEGVGAAAFYFTEEFIGDPNTLDLRGQAGEEPCVPACLNDFSSAGGTPIFFDTEGNRLEKPEVRLKPGITAPDGTNTSFFFSDTSRDDDNGDGVFVTGEPGEFPNFFGTSAAAPNAASIAAMMIDAENSQIIRKGDDGSDRFIMCKPRRGEYEGKESFRGRAGFFEHRRKGRSERRGGRTRWVDPADVREKIDKGWLLGSCRRSEPQLIYHVMRTTAQDMNIQASNGTGETVRVFEEGVVPYARGFDFDSGYGMVDAKAALKRFRRHHYYKLGDDDERDEDEREEDDEREEEEEEEREED